MQFLPKIDIDFRTEYIITPYKWIYQHQESQYRLCNCKSSNRNQDSTSPTSYFSYQLLLVLFKK